MYDDSEGSEINKEFQFFVSYTYLPLPSHTQFVESGVKESAIVSEIGREERSRSILAIVRSHTVEPFLEDARRKMVHKEENKDKKMLPKGYKRTSSIITGVRRQHKKINKLIESGGNLNFSTVSLSVEKQYKRRRRNETVRKCIESKDREDNTAEKTRGLTLTPYGKGIFSYFWVKIPDIQLLRTELNMRNVIFDENF
mgnify:CR=1 FL=1